MELPWIRLARCIGHLASAEKLELAGEVDKRGQLHRALHKRLVHQRLSLPELRAIIEESIPELRGRLGEAIIEQP